jgi:hypothetical protein
MNINTDHHRARMRNLVEAWPLGDHPFGAHLDHARRALALGDLGRAHVHLQEAERLDVVERMRRLTPHSHRQSFDGTGVFHVG